METGVTNHADTLCLTVLEEVGGGGLLEMLACFSVNTGQRQNSNLHFFFC